MSILKLIRMHFNKLVTTKDCTEEKRSNKRTIQTVDVFASDSALKAIAESAILAIELPWNCDQSIKDKAKTIALQSFYKGTTHPTDFIRTLKPTVFKTQKDARHAMVKISAIAWSAVDRSNWNELGIKSFKWEFIDHLCDFPEHLSLNSKTFSVKTGYKGEFPGAKYGCRCTGSPIIL